MGVSADLNNVQPTTKTLNEKCSNLQIIVSKTEGGLYSIMLPNTARQAHIFTNLINSLVSLGALYDAHCTVIFEIKDVTGIYKNYLIL